MADDLSLLLKIRGDSAGGKAAVAETRAAISSLRSTASTEFGQMQSVANVALGSINTSVTNLAARVPALGTVLQSLNSSLSATAAEGAEAATGLAGLVGAMGPVGIAAAGIAVEIGLVGVAFSAATSVAKGLVEQFFALAESAAEWRGALFDTSQQLGISVETLSAFEVLAKTTGSDLGAITASLGIFQKKLEEAQDPLSKTAKLFSDLGISTNNTEEALRDTLTQLAAMPEGFHQTATALELFGRGGKSILAILKEMHGDLDGAIERFREMGLIVSKEDAAAADKFNDELALLHFRFRALLGNEAIPAATAALEALGKLLDENKGLVNALGEAIHLAGMSIQGFTIILDNYLTALNYTTVPLRILVQTYHELADALRDVSSAIPPQLLATGGAEGLNTNTPSGGFLPSSTPRADTGRRGGGGRVRQTDTELQDAIKAAALAEKEALQIVAANVAENKRALEEQVRDIKEFTERAKQLSDDELNAAIDRINAEQAAIEKAFAKKLISRAEFNQRDRELTLETNKAIQDNSDETFRLEQERDKKIAAAEQSARERANQIAEDADKRAIERIQARGERELIAKSEIERQIAAVIDEGFARRRKALEDEDAAYQTSLERHQAIADELIRLDGERAGAAEEAARRIIKAQFDEQNEAAKGATRKRRTTDPDVIDRNVPTSAIDQLFKAVNDNLTGTTQTAALAGLEAMTEAFSGLGQAVGQAAYAWVLYGKAGQSVRQVTAQILASIAQQAAVKAIFELAEGFAALALAFFGIPNAGPSANAHFAAAAIYGSIAGIAAVAGRAIAGDSFTRKDNATGSSTSSSGGGTRGGSSTSPSSQDTNRISYQPQVQVLEFRVKGDAVVDHFARDYMLNGRTRIIITSDGQG